jgi:hypothetical protein
MNGSERTRLIRVLGMTGSSFDGEALIALRQAQKLMGKLTWAELLDSPAASTAPAQELLEQNRRLLHENEALRRSIAQLIYENAKRHQTGAAEEPGHNGADNHRAQARWILGLRETHALAVSERELEFLETVSNWTAPLTEKQQSWFDSLLGRVSRRTGQSPPA